MIKLTSIPDLSELPKELSTQVLSLVFEGRRDEAVALLRQHGQPDVAEQVAARGRDPKASADAEAQWAQIRGILAHTPRLDPLRVLLEALHSHRHGLPETVARHLDKVVGIAPPAQPLSGAEFLVVTSRAWGAISLVIEGAAESPIPTGGPAPQSATDEGPRKGDQILLCGCGDEIHWVRLTGDGDDFATVEGPGGRMLRVKWIVLCDGCHKRPGPLLGKARRERVLTEDAEIIRVTQRAGAQA